MIQRRDTFSLSVALVVVGTTHECPARLRAHRKVACGTGSVVEPRVRCGLRGAKKREGTPCALRPGHQRPLRVNVVAGTRGTRKRRADGRGEQPSTLAAPESSAVEDAGEPLPIRPRPAGRRNPAPQIPRSRERKEAQALPIVRVPQGAPQFLTGSLRQSERGRESGPAPFRRACRRSRCAGRPLPASPP